MADDLDTKQVLRFVLGALKQNLLYLRLQHGWMIALAETVRKHPQLAADLEQHPFYDQGPQRDIQRTELLLQNIDALIQQLKD